MLTYWRVKKVTATESGTTAELQRVSWFKENAEYKALLADESYDGDLPDEFLDAEPGDDGAEFGYIGEGSMTIDLTDSLDVEPGDDVRVVLDALQFASR